MPFLQMIWAASAFLDGRVTEAKRYLQISEQVEVEQAEKPGLIHGWFLESLVNEFFMSMSDRSKSRVLDTTSWRGLSFIYDLVLKLSNSESIADLNNGDILAAIPRILWQQIGWQKNVPNARYFYRFWSIYSFAESNELFDRKYGISLEKFCLISFVFYVQCIQVPFAVRKFNLKDFGFDSSDVDKFLNIVSRDLPSLRKHARKLRHGNQQMAFKKSCLRDFPIIRLKHGSQEVLCAPIPQLICIRSAEGLFFDLVEDGSVRSEYGRRFEQYAYDVTAFRISEEYRIRNEYYYKRNIRSPDILISDDNGCLDVIVECKSRILPMDIRQSSDPWARYPKHYEEIIKGILQIWKYCDFLINNEHECYSVCPEGTHGVVLTLHPWLIASPDTPNHLLTEAQARADRNGIAANARIPIVFSDIDDWELALSKLTASEFIGYVRERAKINLWENERGELGKIVFSNQSTDLPQFPYAKRINEVMPWWDNYKQFSYPTP
ncbi:hypothetical protein GTF89_21865 [Roseobacter sp. HKCCD8309]|nr:hypothetical protein [Roseobacter sp. HKCCD8309]